MLTKRDRARAAAMAAKAERLRFLADQEPDERARRLYARAARLAESNHRRFRTFPVDLYHATLGFGIAMLPWIVLADTRYAELGPPATVLVGVALVVARRRWARAHPVAQPLDE